MTRSDHNAPDKMDEHYRQQLSAMLDGALSPDEARFLLRRLQHDVELGDCWERWQLCGDILRGQAAVELPEQLLPGDFAARVTEAIATDAALPAVNAQPSRWLRWGGGAALAASVAVVALMAVRQSPESIQPDASAPVEVASAPAPSLPTADPAATSTSPAPVTPDPAAVVVAGVAAVAVQAPRRTMAARTRARNVATPVAVAVSAPPDVDDATEAAATDAALIDAATAVAAQAGPDGPAEGFVLRQPPRTKPWPRALIPDYPASGGFTVGHPGTTTTSSFQPFEPRKPAEVEARPDDRAETPR